MQFESMGNKTLNDTEPHLKVYLNQSQVDVRIRCFHIADQSEES